MSNRVNKLRARKKSVGLAKLPDVYLDAAVFDKLNKLARNFRYEVGQGEKSLGYQAIISLAIENLYVIEEKAQMKRKHTKHHAKVRIAQQRVLAAREIDHMKKEGCSPKKIAEMFSKRHVKERLGHPDGRWEGKEIKALCAYRKSLLPLNITDRNKKQQKIGPSKIDWLDE